MNSDAREKFTTDEIQRRIESCRDAFRQAWIDGQSPNIGDFIEAVPNARAQLIPALLAVEVEQCRSSGKPLTEQQLMELHPSIAAELIRAFRTLRANGTDDAAAIERTLPLEPKQRGERTIDHTPTRKDSRGLHIRCPHCSNAVELITDTPYEQICCSTCGSMFSLVDREEPTQTSAPLKTIGRFDLIARLGVGGFGTVWKARDRELDRVVAIKIPRRGQLAPNEIDQFFREARTAAQLRHANIVPIHEVGRDGETLFIVSDFVRGVTLSDWLTGKRPNTLEVIELCIPIADALHHAHEQGVVHRDLKPANIMIDEAGQPFIMDFGLAKREIGEITMTVDGQIIGTPRYMSPEQARGQGHWTDRRTDIYSFGVILFELLTGELPFRGSAQMQIHQRLTEDAPDPRKLNRHVPRDLATICLKCLEREPGRRYSTAAAVAEELRRFRRGEPIEARPISKPARLARWARRKPMVATTVALTLFLAIAGPVAALLIERQRARLAELVVEKNNLIERAADENRRATGQITQLRNQIELWEGRTNPWEFWPPKPDEPPREAVLADLLEHSRRTLVGANQSDEYSTAQVARAHLAIALMADALGGTADASEHYEAARNQLVALLEQNPHNPQIARAIAECHSQLARLVGKTNRAKAAENLKNAAAIYEQLAARDASEPTYSIALLENKLISATLAGFVTGQQHLVRAAELSRTLSERWPKDADAIYRLACYLTGREPILSSPLGSADAAKLTSGITGPSD